jgi:hypothetical protein
VVGSVKIKGGWWVSYYVSCFGCCLTRSCSEYSSKVPHAYCSNVIGLLFGASRKGKKWPFKSLSYAYSLYHLFPPCPQTLPIIMLNPNNISFTPKFLNSLSLSLSLVIYIYIYIIYIYIYKSFKILKLKALEQLKVGVLDIILLSLVYVNFIY